MPKPRVITPSQTVGPFFSFCLTHPVAPLSRLGARRLSANEHGTPITISGRMLDGMGQPVPDAMIEVWQADGDGRYVGSPDACAADGGFTGFARVDCNHDGCFVIETIKPGRSPAPAGGLQAPHLALGIFGKGLNRRLYTRLYFGDEGSNDEDPVLTSVPLARRETLVARPAGQGAYTFDIRLQGGAETVFFEA